MAEPSLGEILLLLGEIKGGMAALDEKVDRLGADFRGEKEVARVNRGEIHRRLDDQGERIGEVDKAVTLAVEGNRQTRDMIGDIRTVVAGNHAQLAPHIEDFKRLKTIGLGISGLIALGGLTIGGIVAYATDAARAAVKGWLG